MINLDKIKNEIGKELFNFIGSLNKEQLNNMLNCINTDIKLCESIYPEIVTFRKAEKSFIEYRLI